MTKNFTIYNKIYMTKIKLLDQLRLLLKTILSKLSDICIDLKHP